ncbi:hypothetical protein YYG_05179, partial [Plasmodium vinckei petteri]
MAPYSIEDLYRDINKIDDYFYESTTGYLIVPKNSRLIHKYCHYGNTSGNCNGYFEMTSSGLIHLLKKLKDTHRLEDDKLSEYAILWLIYKLNVQTKRKFANLNDFYNSYIVNNKCYNDKIKGDNSLTYKEIIDKKKDLMNINNKEISKFNIPFYILFDLYNTVYDEYVNCTYKSNYAKIFVDKFKEINKDSNNIEESLYNKLLSTLSDDYNKLKKIYHNKKCTSFPSIPQIEPKKKPSENPAANSGKVSEQMLVETPKVTSSSSSISTTLIPGLSVFSVIPVFLGIAYKVNNKELKTIIFKLYFCDPLY